VAAPAGAFAGMTGSRSIYKALENLGKPDDAESSYAKLTDPDHEGALQAIRAKATLAALLKSPAFSGEKPDHVVNAYNQLAAVSPRDALNGPMAQAAVRRSLAQGGTDLYDIDQLLSVDKKLRDRDQLPMGSAGAATLADPKVAPAKKTEGDE
jgi:hypothetical protein